MLNIIVWKCHIVPSISYAKKSLFKNTLMDSYIAIRLVSSYACKVGSTCANPHLQYSIQIVLSVEMMWSPQWINKKHLSSLNMINSWKTCKTWNIPQNHMSYLWQPSTQHHIKWVKKCKAFFSKIWKKDYQHSSSLYYFWK